MPGHVRGPADQGRKVPRMVVFTLVIVAVSEPGCAEGSIIHRDGRKTSTSSPHVRVSRDSATVLMYTIVPRGKKYVLPPGVVTVTSWCFGVCLARWVNGGNNRSVSY